MRNASRFKRAVAALALVAIFGVGAAVFSGDKLPVASADHNEFTQTFCLFFGIEPCHGAVIVPKDGGPPGPICGTGPEGSIKPFTPADRDDTHIVLRPNGTALLQCQFDLEDDDFVDGHPPEKALTTKISDCNIGGLYFGKGTFTITPGGNAHLTCNLVQFNPPPGF